MFALFSGLLGTAFSVLIRMELSGPGVQYIADNQLVRRTSITVYIDYFLYATSKVREVVMANLNLTIFPPNAYPAKGFPFRAIITSYRFVSLNETIRSQITRINLGRP